MSKTTAFVKYPDLADGSTLVRLKEEYLKERDRDSLVSLLSCLRESFVRVPMSVTMSDRDRARLQRAKDMHDLDTFKAEDEVRLKPELLTTPDGRRFFPVFSRPEEIPPRYAGQYTVFEEAMENCIRMARATEGINGLVLDAFTKPMILPFDIAEMILHAKKMHA